MLHLQPSVKTCLHVFDHTVVPILLYGSEIWGSFDPKKAKFRNGINLEKIYKNIEPEKIHVKFLKYILGVHKKSSNFAVLSEFGRYPLYINIVKAML